MKTILLVDDDTDLNESLRDALVEGGYTVTSCANGWQALEALRRVAPDLLLIDGSMPGLDGFGVLRIMHEKPGTDTFPIVLMSAEKPKGLQSEFKWTEFIQKPIQLEALEKLIARLIPV